MDYATFDICPDDLITFLRALAEFLNMVVGGNPTGLAGFMADLLEHGLCSAWNGYVDWDVSWRAAKKLYKWREQSRTLYLPHNQN